MSVRDASSPWVVGDRDGGGAGRAHAVDHGVDFRCGAGLAERDGEVSGVVDARVVERVQSRGGEPGGPACGQFGEVAAERGGVVG
jgi:hypothetical protein